MNLATHHVFYKFLRFKTLCTQFFGFWTQTKNANCSSNKQQFSIFQLFASHLRHGMYDMRRISKYQYRKHTHTTRKSSKLTFQYLLTRKKLKISRAYHKILTVEFLHKQITLPLSTREEVVPFLSAKSGCLALSIVVLSLL